MFKKILVFIIVVVSILTVFTVIFVLPARDKKQRFNSPFGIHDVKILNTQEYEAVKDLGVRNIRSAPEHGIVWPQIEKVRGNYFWKDVDSTIMAAKDLDVELFVTVSAKRERGPGKMPENLEWFLEFLSKVAERYDGDGIKDALGSPVIDVIQIDNEVDSIIFWNDTPENYARLLKESYRAIKNVSPHIKVAIAGAATPDGFYRFYPSIFAPLKEVQEDSHDQYFDIFDFHWSGQFFNTYEMSAVITDIRHEIETLGYKNIDLYITEMSDYSDTPKSPNGPAYSAHTETDQAVSLIQRYVSALALGVQKIYWTQIMEHHDYGNEQNGYFDNVGLVNNLRNDGRSHTKLSYYVYKKMVEMLEDSDWESVQTLPQDSEVHIYTFTKFGKPILVVWSDNKESKNIILQGIPSGQITITHTVPRYESGKEVVDFSNAFTSWRSSVYDNTITLPNTNIPLYIEYTDGD